MRAETSDVNKDLSAKNRDKDKDFILVLKESLRQGQGQGLTSLALAGRLD